MEENLNKILYINEYLIKEKNELRKKIYEKIINLKDYSKLNNKENFLFQEVKPLFEHEDENEYQEYKKLADKYDSLNNLTRAINFFSNEIKKKS